MPIELLKLKCYICRDARAFTASDHVRRVAHKAGWRERAKGWICDKCRDNEFTNDKETDNGNDV